MVGAAKRVVNYCFKMQCRSVSVFCKSSGQTRLYQDSSVKKTAVKKKTFLCLFHRIHNWCILNITPGPCWVSLKPFVLVIIVVSCLFLLSLMHISSGTCGLSYPYSRFKTHYGIIRAKQRAKTGEKSNHLTNITLYIQILEAMVIFTLNLTKKRNCYMTHFAFIKGL